MARREQRILQRSYRSSVDGTRSPYVVYLPRRYAQEKCPLLLWLHGFGGVEGEGLNDAFMDIADEFDYVVVMPRGRGSVFYDCLGEDDVMEILRRARKEFRTSPGRTFAAGASMGGTGALRLSSRHPDEFAAALAICGWAHWRFWYSKWYGPLDAPESRHPAHVPLLARADTIPALWNLLHVPVYIMHGARDPIVDADESRAAFGELSRLGYEVFFKEYARSKHKAFRRRWRAAFRWFEGAGARSWLGAKGGKRKRRTSVKRVPRGPAEIRYLSVSPRNRRAYWAELEPADCNLPARMRLSWDGSRVEAETENVSRLTLFRKDSPWNSARRLCVSWRGEEVWSGKPSPSPSPSASVEVEVEVELEPRRGTKRPRLSGPISDAFRDPILVCAGSGRARREAEAWVDAWNRWLVPEETRGLRRVSPGDVSRAEMNSRHLLLFGTPEENGLVKAASSRMDVTLSREKIRLYGRSWQGKSLGLRLIHPNPLAPGKYLLIFFGEMGERIKQTETIGWYWPDWVVFDETQECRRAIHPYWDDYDDAVARGELDPETVDPRELPLQYLPDMWLGAGSFDSSWRLS